MKLSKPFRKQLTHYAETLFHELLTNMSRKNCPISIGSTKSRPLTSCVMSLAQYMYEGGGVMADDHINIRNKMAADKKQC